MHDDVALWIHDYNFTVYQIRYEAGDKIEGELLEKHKASSDIAQAGYVFPLRIILT